MDRTIIKFEYDKGVIKLHKMGKNFYVLLNKSVLFYDEDFNEVNEFYFNITKQLIGKDTII